MERGKEIHETTVGRETTTGTITNTSKEKDYQRYVNKEPIPGEQAAEASNATADAARAVQENGGSDLRPPADEDKS